MKTVYVSVNDVKGNHSYLNLASYLRIPVHNLADWRQYETSTQRQAKIDQAIHQIINYLKFVKLAKAKKTQNTKKEGKGDQQKSFGGCMMGMMKYWFTLCDQNLNELQSTSLNPGALPASANQEEESKDNH